MSNKNVTFTKKVVSKTTVSTGPKSNAKPILKRPPPKYKIGPDGRYINGPKKGWRAVTCEESIAKPKSAMEERPPFVPPRPPYSEEEISHRERERSAVHNLERLRIPVSGARMKKRIGRVPVMPILPEDRELEAMWRLPKDRYYDHGIVVKHPEPPQPPPQDWLDTNYPIIDEGLPPEFDRYRAFLENYSASIPQVYKSPTPAPPPSPEQPPDLIDWGADMAPEPDAMMYGPPDPLEEVAYDPTFYPAAAAMVEGGLMDCPPQADLPPPLIPSPFQPPGYGPHQSIFPQPTSTKRHRMVGWRDPQVHLYRPDLPPASPYYPYMPAEIGYVGAEDDLIRLQRPPIWPTPTAAELSQLRYTPPPASPSDRPYTGMYEGEWDRFMSSPPPRAGGSPQYSPTRLPVRYGESFPPPYSPPQFTPRPPSPVRTPPPPSPEVFYGPEYDPPKSPSQMNLTEWLSSMMPKVADPFAARPTEPASPFRSAWPPSPHTPPPSPYERPHYPGPCYTPPPSPFRRAHYSSPSNTPPPSPYERPHYPGPCYTPPPSPYQRPHYPQPSYTPPPQLQCLEPPAQPRVPSPRAPSPPRSAPLKCPPKRAPIRRPPPASTRPKSAEAEAKKAEAQARQAEARKKMLAAKAAAARNRKAQGGDFEVNIC